MGHSKHWELLGLLTPLLFLPENLVAHRALQLLDMLPKAISLGISDIDEPLMVSLLLYLEGRY